MDGEMLLGISNILFVTLLGCLVFLNDLMRSDRMLLRPAHY